MEEMTSSMRKSVSDSNQPVAGRNLDRIGLVLDLPRKDGEADENYNERLKARAKACGA